MMRAVTGKPRSGKTAYCVNEFYDILRYTRLAIGTNMALRLQPWVDAGGVCRPGLLRIVQDKFGEDYDLERRLYLFKDEEVYRFYAVRVILPRDSADREVIILPRHDDNRFRMDGSKHPAMAYFIDEAHEFFPGAAVIKQDDPGRVREMLSWGSQQARAGDQTYLMSQVMMNVNKQLRSVCQECVSMINHRHLSMAIFRQPAVISYAKYQTTPPKEGEHWLSRDQFRYNKEEIYGAYDTAAGVGVSGRGADVKERAKGLHWAWIPVFVFAFLFAIWYGFGVLRERGSRKLAGMLGSKPVGLAASNSVGLRLNPALAQTYALTMEAERAKRDAELKQAFVAGAEFVRTNNAKPEKVELPKCYSEGRSGELWCLDTENGIIYGTTLEKKGGVWTLDGEQFKKSVRRVVSK